MQQERAQNPLLFIVKAHKGGNGNPLFFVGKTRSKPLFCGAFVLVFSVSLCYN